MPSLSADALDRRVTIVKTILVSDGMQKVPTPVDYGTVWASVTPVSDGERLRGGEQQADVVSRFQIRWSRKMAQVDRTYFVRYPADGGPLYGIFGVKEIGRQDSLEISATAPAVRAT